LSSQHQMINGGRSGCSPALAAPDQPDHDLRLE
jgi:hypothetical protein